MPILEGGFDVPMPRLIPVHQSFPRPCIADLEAHVRGLLARPEAREALAGRRRVAVAVGSRGIGQLAAVVRAAVAGLKEAGTEPFIVPGMGSHGGATADGQRRVLAHYGVDEARSGAPVHASMETVRLGETPDGLPVYFDRLAAEADAVVPINRIKPHTDFHGPVESGLTKMLVIGLGKHRGATAVHRRGYAAFPTVLPAAARVILARAPVVFGLAIVENAYEEPARIELLFPPDLPAGEGPLLAEARSLMARLPFPSLDVLIVSRMGKDISGAGLDPNVTGRYMPRFMQLREHEPVIEKIVALALTPGTEGNATGVGLVDVVTRCLVDAIDYPQTYANVITATELGGGRIPVTMETDRQAIAVALHTLTRREPAQAHTVWIRDTLSLEELAVSAALLPQVEAHPRLEAVGPPAPMTFDDEERFLPPVTGEAEPRGRGRDHP